MRAVAEKVCNVERFHRICFMYMIDVNSFRWHYPSRGFLEKMTPSVPGLFAITRGALNVQVCDRYV